MHQLNSKWLNLPLGRHCTQYLWYQQPHVSHWIQWSVEFSDIIWTQLMNGHEKICWGCHIQVNSYMTRKPTNWCRCAKLLVGVLTACYLNSRPYVQSAFCRSNLLFVGCTIQVILKSGIWNMACTKIRNEIHIKRFTKWCLKFRIEKDRMRFLVIYKPA